MKVLQGILIGMLLTAIVAANYNYHLRPTKEQIVFSEFTAVGSNKRSKDFLEKGFKKGFRVTAISEGHYLLLIVMEK